MAGHDWLSKSDEARLRDIVTGLKKCDKSEPARKLPMTMAVLASVQSKCNMTAYRDYQHITMARVAHDALL